MKTTMQLLLFLRQHVWLEAVTCPHRRARTLKSEHIGARYALQDRLHLRMLRDSNRGKPRSESSSTGICRAQPACEPSPQAVISGRGFCADLSHGTQHLAASWCGCQCQTTQAADEQPKKRCCERCCSAWLAMRGWRWLSEIAQGTCLLAQAVETVHAIADHEQLINGSLSDKPCQKAASS